jgi:hypothetical protein
MLRWLSLCCLLAGSLWQYSIAENSASELPEEMTLLMIEPTSVCGERFVAPKDIAACEKKIRTLSPDWYLTASCQKQFSHEGFWDCLNLNALYFFDPKKLGACQEPMQDSERMECIRKVGLAWPGSPGKGAPSKKQRVPSGQRANDL